MATEVKVPVLPESVADATIATWHKKPGDAVSLDENIVDIETDKVMLEVPATCDGVLQDIFRQEGDTVKAEETIGMLLEGAPAANTAAESPEKTPASDDKHLTPAVRRAVSEQDLDVNNLTGTGKGGRITKQDLSTDNSQPAPAKINTGARQEKRVPMTRLRKRVAERLVQSQQTAAILTTFNEVDLTNVMLIRKRYQESFVAKYGIKLGFMSFFIKAAIEALKKIPAVNSSIDGDDIIYHGFFDVSVAVSTERGLVVPVIRDADKLNFAEIELKVAEYGKKARENKLTLEELQGGTFTVSNGGIFGSLLSTPIINPPQSGILGMHKIEERAVVVNKEIKIRPMMYLALSYDHRIIDGKESVTFLKTIKETLEDPTRILLEI